MKATIEYDAGIRAPDEDTSASRRPQPAIEPDPGQDVGAFPTLENKGSLQ